VSFFAVACRRLRLCRVPKGSPLICASSHQSNRRSDRAPPASRITRLLGTSARPAWSRVDRQEKSPSSIPLALAKNDSAELATAARKPRQPILELLRAEPCSGWLLILRFWLVLGGVWATLGDRLGSRVAKGPGSSLFNLRPPQTAVTDHGAHRPALDQARLCRWGCMLAVSERLAGGGCLNSTA